MLIKQSTTIVMVVACLGLLSRAAAQGPAGDHLFISTGVGQADTMELVSPWNRQLGVEAIGSDAIVRNAFGKVYVVNRSRDTIQVIDVATQATNIEFSVGAGTAPQDILVVSPTVAYVTRRHAQELLRVDPTTGEQQSVANLHLYGGGGVTPNMAMMARDGDLAFIQVQRTDFMTGEQLPGYLAVFNLKTERLVRERLTSGSLPGVALVGPNPDYKMQVDAADRVLYVTTHGMRNDFAFGDTGIEAVDLDTRTSLGFVITEDQLGADVSAFAIVSPTKGYCLAHTDIVASTHLRVFEPNVGQIGELFVSTRNMVTSLPFDAATNQLFFPDGNVGTTAATASGIRVFDTLTDEEISSGALPISGFPVDLTIVRTGP